MQKYIEQLLSDIDYAAANVSMPFIDKDVEWVDFISDKEEDKIAPVLKLNDWTGINSEMLPPATMLEEKQINQLLHALKKMLDAYNWSFVLQILVPENIQYETIRHNFNQQAKIKQWHPGFFSMCKDGTPHNTCSLGQYCHALFMLIFFQALLTKNLHLRKKEQGNWK
jgi:hypothetical protein